MKLGQPNQARTVLPFLRFLILQLLLARGLASHAPLTTPFINCPCTFTLTRPISDDTPFSILIHTSSQTLSQRNLSNRHADFINSTNALFYTSINFPTRHALVLHSENPNFEIRYVTHTTCPILLDQHPPTLFRQRIVGGSAAAPDLRDYLASLYDPATRKGCTATMISPTWALTAAHCNVTERHTAYVSGDRARQGEPYPILRVQRYPDFNDVYNPKFDIALVELATPVFGPSFMRVSVNPSVPIPGSAARVLGYGSVEYDSPTQGILFGQLRQVDVPIVTQEECVFAYNSVSELYQVCAGYLGEGGCDSCQGDSGGPLIQYDANDEPVLVGVVSRGHRCGEARFPGIYIRVGAFEEWLDSFVDDYAKAETTTAVLAVVGSSQGTLINIGVPVIAVCGGVLVIGLVIVVLVRLRRSYVKKKSFDSDASTDEETGDTDITPTWQGERKLQNGRHSAPVRTLGIEKDASIQRPWSTPTPQGIESQVESVVVVTSCPDNRSAEDKTPERNTEDGGGTGTDR